MDPTKASLPRERPISLGEDVSANTTIDVLVIFI